MTFTLLYSFSSVRQAYRWAHGAAAVLHIASVAALIGFSVRDSTASARYAIALNINYKAWLPGSPNATDCDTYQCVPTDTTASYQEVNLLHACAVFGAWSGIFHIVAVIKLWGTGNNDELNKNVLRAIRAMDYGVSAPVMLLVVYGISGGNDFTGAVVSAGLMSAVIWLDYFGRQNKATERYSFIVASALYTLAWFPIFITFDQAAYSGATVGTVESVTAPDFVIIIIAAIAAAFTSFAIARVATTRSFEKEESAFITLSLVAKTILHWTLFNGILNRPNILSCDNSEVPVDPTPRKDPTNDVYTAVGVSVGVGLVLGVYMYMMLAKAVRDNKRNE